MIKQPKTKLIWSVTQQGCQQSGVDFIADVISKYGLHAVRSVYSSEMKNDLVQLRKSLNQKLASEKNQPADGKIPFLLSLVGRKAFVSTEQSDIIVQDGDEIQVAFFVDFKACARFSLSTTQKKERIEIVVSSQDQLSGLKAGSILDISYGNLELKIISSIKKSDAHAEFKCQVVRGGVLYSGMEVHSNDMPRDLFPLLDDDKKTLENRFSHLADFVIINGIQNEEEFLLIKESLIGKQSLPSSERHPSIAITEQVLESEAILPPRFLLKIDSKRAFDLLPVLFRHVDGVFLSRSELGLDVHPHDLPILQKELISECNQNGKMIVIASELMHSMRLNANPTRAEVSDMANAAADGADALLLSSEVTEGPNAELIAEVSFETLVNSEAWLEEKWKPLVMNSIQIDDDAVTYGAASIAQQTKAKAIVCFTEGGYTAVKLSSLGTPIPVIAITCNKRIMRQVGLMRSVTGVILESKFQVEKILSEAKEILVNRFDFKAGDTFVFVSLTASSVSARQSNLFTLQEI